MKTEPDSVETGRSRSRLKFRCARRQELVVGGFDAATPKNLGERLRHPRFLGLRRDRKPRRIVRERPTGG